MYMYRPNELAYQKEAESACRRSDRHAQVGLHGLLFCAAGQTHLKKWEFTDSTHTGRNNSKSGSPLMTDSVRDENECVCSRHAYTSERGGNIGVQSYTTHSASRGGSDRPMKHT